MLRSLVPTVISAAALVLAGVAALRGAPEPAPANASVCREGITRAEYQRLEQQVQALGSLARREAAAPGDATSPAAAAAEPGSAGETARAEAPHYVRFEAPRGISIEAKDNGALAVRNDDPAIAGQTLVIKGERDDGTSDVMTIIVPPPTGR